MANGPYNRDEILTTISQQWKNDDDAFIAPKLLPTITVKKTTGVYAEYGKEALVVPSNLLRTGRSKTAEASYSKVYKDFGPLQERALKDFITKDELEQEDSPLDVETDTVIFLNQQMAIAEEADAAAILTSTSVIANNQTLSGTAQWTDSASDPLKNLKDRIIAFRGNAIKLPNTVMFSFNAWIALIGHASIIERFKYAQGGSIGKAEILNLLAPYGITEIIIGKSMASFTAEGQATSVVDIWGGNVLITYLNPTPGLRQVNGGYTLRLENGKYVDKWDENDPKGEFIRNNDYFDQVIFSTDVYGLIKNAVA